VVPIACEAFEDYRMGAMHLTRLEIEAIRSGSPIATQNKREMAEFDEKRKRLGL
jgi:thymidylate synthase (FAD)